MKQIFIQATMNDLQLKHPLFTWATKWSGNEFQIEATLIKQMTSAYNPLEKIHERFYNDDHE